MLRFRLFGIPVIVEPWHWAVLAFIGGALHIRDRADLPPVLMFVVAGFLSILIHEFGHALTGRRFGGRPHVVLHWMGGVAIFPGAHFSRGQNILVSAAGPAVQLAMGAATLGILEAGWIPDVPIRSMVEGFAVISIFWAIINLVPVFPLDGGQILFHALGARRQSLSLRISMVSAIVVAVGMFMLYQSIFFPMLMGVLAYQNYQDLTRRFR